MNYQALIRLFVYTSHNLASSLKAQMQHCDTMPSLMLSNTSAQPSAMAQRPRWRYPNTARPRRLRAHTWMPNICRVHGTSFQQQLPQVMVPRVRLWIFLQFLSASVCAISPSLVCGLIGVHGVPLCISAPLVSCFHSHTSYGQSQSVHWRLALHRS